MMPHERRLSVRKPLDQVVCLSLPSNNGGFVLDVSEGGLGFHAIGPVEADGPIRFRFAMDSVERLTAVGELAWKDETGKIGGLRFTELPDEVREQIRVWADESKASFLNIPFAKPAIETKSAPGSNGESAPVAGAGNSLLHSLMPSAYSAPINELSMFPLDLGFKERATAAVVPQFVQMLDGFADQIRIWAAQSKASVHDTPFADLSVETEAAPRSETELAPVVDIPAVEPAIKTEVAPRSETELAPVVDIPAVEPAIETEAAPSNEADLAPAVATGNPLLYHVRTPIYRRPSNNLSIFPLGLNSEEGAAAVAVPQSFTTKHPLAAVGLTIALAFLVSVGTFVYLSTTRAGDLLYDWGGKMLDGFYSQPIPRVPAPPASSTPASAKTPQR